MTAGLIAYIRFMIERILLLVLIAWALPASAQFPMLQPDTSGYPQCGEMIQQARKALDMGNAEKAITLTTACIDSTDEQWAHYVRARAKLFLKDTMGYCFDMRETWNLPKERKLEFRSICAIKDSGTLSQMGLDATRFPGIKTVRTEWSRLDSTQFFRLFDASDTLLAAFMVHHMDTLFTVSPVPLEFKGGNERLNPWLSKNIKYPDPEFDAGINGRVYVRFIVNEKGKVVNAHIERSPAEAFSKEVLRVLAKMPRWKPARAFGRKVRSLRTLPVDFKLQ